MDFLTGLHGSLVTVLLCALLFVDEAAGVPMPFAPNEALLVVAGILIASGSLPWFIIYPLAVLAILLGAFSGYSWARAVGEDQLRTLAGKFRAAKAYDQAVVRVRNANARQIAVIRCIPGIRVYATLAAGAARVPLRTFMIAAVPSAFVWTTVLLGAGIVVGAPAAHFFSEIQKLALSGALLVALGVLAFRAARKAPKDWEANPPFAGMASPHRMIMAFVLDAALVTVITAGVDRITRSVLEVRIADFPQLVPKGLEFLVLLIAMAIFYVVSLRHGGVGETAGERVFDVSYVHLRHHRQALPPPVTLTSEPEAPQVEDPHKSVSR